MVFECNALGLRGPAIAPRPIGGRVVVVGDSLTFGWGVELSEAYPAQLEVALEHDCRTPVQVVNAGLPALGLADEMRWLNANGAPLEPSLVIVGFFLNDLEDAAEQTPLPPPAAGRLGVWLHGQSALSRRIDASLWEKRVRASFTDRYAPEYEPQSARWHAALVELDRLDAWSRHERVPVLLAVLPVSVDYEALAWLGPAEDRVVAAASERRIEAVALRERLGRADFSGDRVDRFDPHPSARLHSELARVLAPLVERRLAACRNAD